MNYYGQYGQYGQYPNSQNNGLLWVQGEAGAKSWIVAPGQTVMLMDSEKEQFYVKSADASGMPTLKAYKYEPIEGNTTPKTSEPEYVTLDAFEALKAKCEALEEKLTKKKKGADNE